MWLNFFVIIGLFVAFLFFLYLFLADLITVAINGVIIYLIGLRVYAEIKKSRKHAEDYLIGCVIAALLVVLIGTYFPFWQVTTFFVITFFATQLMRLLRSEA